MLDTLVETARMAASDVEGPETPARPSRQIIRREGEYWTILYAGEICRLKDANGVRYLAYLLHRPHLRVAAVQIERSAGTGRNESTEGEADRATQERARVNVTRALSGVRKRIAVHHPALVRHLEATLRTGAFCTYSPDPRVVAVWEG